MPAARLWSRWYLRKPTSLVRLLGFAALNANLPWYAAHLLNPDRQQAGPA